MTESCYLGKQEHIDTCENCWAKLGCKKNKD